jgi:hypothetical protein
MHLLLEKLAQMLWTMIPTREATLQAPHLTMNKMLAVFCQYWMIQITLFLVAAHRAIPTLTMGNVLGLMGTRQILMLDYQSRSAPTQRRGNLLDSTFHHQVQIDTMQSSYYILLPIIEVLNPQSRFHPTTATSWILPLWNYVLSQSRVLRVFT